MGGFLKMSQRQSNQWVRRLSLGCLVILGTLLPAAAFAQAPTVATVPWVPAQHLIPHDIVSGRATRLKGAEIHQGGVYRGNSYRWDYGDGGNSGWIGLGSNEQRRVIEGARTYNGVAGSPFNAVLTVCTAANGGGTCASSTYRMTIRDNTLTARVNIAIDEGLWYLYKYSASGVGGNGRMLPPGSYGDLASGHAASLNAFFAHGHLESYNRNTNPYVDVVTTGMTYLTGSLVQTVGIAGKNTGNPDVNANGLGATVNGRDREVYQNGMLMDAIVTSGTPNANVTNGPYVNRTRSFLLQDFIDGYAWGQIDNCCGRVAPERGSWNYTYAPGHPDNSSSQWAAIGMIPAERQWGLTIPAFVKNESALSIDSMYSDGQIGYHLAPNQGGCIWGCAGTTPSGLVLWTMAGRQSNEARFTAAMNWIVANWGAGPNEGNTGLVTGYTYGLFAAVKTFRLTRPNPTNVHAGFDWYNDPGRGVAHTLTTRQRADGGFNGVGVTDQGGLWTQWSLLMLAGNLFAQAPQAVPSANPVRAAINQLVTFDHSQSFHLDPARSIVRYEWDFDGDGNFDFNTANGADRPTFRFNPALNQVPRVYTARLRVTDDSNPALQDIKTVSITVDTGNVPPVAVITPGNPSVTVNVDLALSGANSSDPNAGAPLNDRIVRYEWDFDDSNGLVQFQDLGVNVTTRFGGACGVNRQVALRVTDNFGLQNTAFATVNVLCNQPPVARVVPNPLNVNEGEQGTISGSHQLRSRERRAPVRLGLRGRHPHHPHRWQPPAAGRCAQHRRAAGNGTRFNCTLTVTDPLGASNQVAFVIIVNNVDTDGDGSGRPARQLPGQRQPRPARHRSRRPGRRL
jgi:hypothetical protein